MEIAPERSTMIHALDLSAAMRAADALDYVRQRTPGKLWDIIGLLIECRFYCPAWLKYCNGMRKEGGVLRGNTPRLRERILSWNDAGNIRSEDYAHQLELYATSRLRPPSEDEDSLFFDRLRLFEGYNLDIPSLLDEFNRLPVNTLGKFLTSASDSGQMDVLPSEAVANIDLANLLSAGFAVPAQNAPVAILLRRMKASELYLPIKARRLKLTSYGSQSYRDFYSAHMDDGFEHDLRASKWLEGQYVYTPPTEDWEGFQDFRTYYSEMIGSTIRWIDSSWVGVGEERYFQL